MNNPYFSIITAILALIIGFYFAIIFFEHLKQKFDLFKLSIWIIYAIILLPIGIIEGAWVGLVKVLNIAKSDIVKP